MRTVLYILTAFAVIGLAFWAYRENYATQQALSRCRDLQHEIRAATARLAVLQGRMGLSEPPRPSARSGRAEL